MGTHKTSLKFLFGILLVVLSTTIPICNSPRRAVGQPPAPTDLGVFTTPRLLSVTKSGTGSGTVTAVGVNCGTNCFQNYEDGTVTVLTASPASGSAFTGWSGGGCSGTGSCVVSMTSAQTVIATFTLVGVANKFASPTGTGSPNTCTSSSSPCSLTRALTQLTCGDILQLGNGEYTGSPALNVRSSSTPAITCTSGSQMTVQAETDGGVLFTGPNTSAAAAVDIRGATYWNFTGFNARRGFDVVQISSSSHVNLRRVVAWDAPANLNSQVLLVQNSSDVLVEDVAAFGLSTEVCMDFGTNSNLVWRRVWCRTEGSTGDVAPGGGPSVAVQFNYTDDSWPTPGLFENVIMTAQATSRSGTMDYISNLVRHTAVSPYVRLYGGIHYPESGASFNGSYLTTDAGNSCSGYILQDSIIHHNGTNKGTIHAGHISNSVVCGTGETGIHHYLIQLTRLTLVKGSVGNDIGSDATQTNVIEGTGLGSFDYQGTGNTAKLCFRYENGVYGTTKLWPWPMDNRIRDAIASNSGSATLAGSAGTGYAANTVTSEIVSIFGTIPSACIN